MAYTHVQKIKFKHCDPAGIVFYPRYFEMINDTVEASFEIVLGYPFGAMHPDNGVPTVQIETQFMAPCRMGEVIEITLHVRRLGTSSLDLAFVAVGGQEKRFAATSTLVHVGAGGRPTGWPGPVRAILQEHLEGMSDGT